MKRNENKISGVLHNSLGQKNYNLRRYFPDESFDSLIEQFWLVDWDLKDKKSHTQQNLPDPNFHLVFDNNRLKIIGPVSKTYSYTMKAKGQIFGVKFMIGALYHLINVQLSECVDKEFDAEKLLMLDTKNTCSLLQSAKTDQQVITILQSFITPLLHQPSQQQHQVRLIMETIKNNHQVLKVEHLSEQINTSVRTIQRLFQKYVGLSPKLLIRKYRLHYILHELDSDSNKVYTLLETLGYSDQSHFIHDFKKMLSVTPNRYTTE